MKLYPKKLNSLKALKKEKMLLKKRAASEPIVAKDTVSSTMASGVEGFDIYEIAREFLGSKSALSMILALSAPLLRLIPEKTRTSYLRKFLREFAGNYAKGKAVTIGYDLLRHFIKTVLRHGKEKPSEK